MADSAIHGAAGTEDDGGRAGTSRGDAETSASASSTVQAPAGNEKCESYDPEKITQKIIDAVAEVTYTQLIV